MLRRFAERRAAKVDRRRADMIASFLEPEEKVVENAPVHMLGNVAAEDAGFLFVTNKRLIWHFPNALAHQTGGVPLTGLVEAAYDDYVLALKSNAGSALGFQLYPSPISDVFADVFVAQAKEASRGATRKEDQAFVQSSDPLRVLGID